jgi:membrane protease YdiL (CAAX protease family)
MSIAEPRAVPTRAVAVFLALSFGVAWIGSLPLLLGGGGQVGGAGQLLTAAAAMTAPAVGVLVAGLAIERISLRQLLRTTGVVARRPFGPLLRYSAAGVVVIAATQVLGLVAGTALGWFRPDLAGLSGLHAALGIAPGAPVLATVAALALFYVVAGVPFVLFEEWGWRGYLEPRLQPWGIVPMILVSGLIWGLWHLPAAFSVGRDPAAWLGVYLVGSVLVGTVLCWLRLRTGSIWPAVAAHCAISSFPGPLLPLWSSDAAAGYTPARDDLLFSSLGTMTWAFTGVVALALIRAELAGSAASGRARPALCRSARRSR